MGALRVSKVVDKHHAWPLITCLWSHGGAFHLLASMLGLSVIGIQLEQEFGFGMSTKYRFSPPSSTLLST